MTAPAMLRAQSAPYYNGTGLPGACTENQTIYWARANTTFVCDAASTWRQYSLLQSTVAGLPSATLFPSLLAKVTNGTSSTDCTGGGGTSITLCVATSGTWTALSGAASSVPFSGVTSGTNSNALVVGGSLQIRTGTLGAIPGTCTVGQIYFANDQTAGQNVYGCTATNTWTLQGGKPAGQIAAGSLCAAAGCVLNETANWTYAVMLAGTIQSCGVVATTAPTGTSIIVDVLYNGSSIFGANPKPTVATSSTTYAAVSTFSTSAVTVGGLITFKVTQVDTNNVGQFVRATCLIQ